MLRKMVLMAVVAVGFASSVMTAQAKKLETAILAGGCFWCVESDFDRVKGIVETTSGYAGGSGANPTYDTYIKKGHIEVVKIVYDAETISFKNVLDVFWHSVNPTDPGGQFCDRGRGYSTAILAQNRSQIAVAKASKLALQKANPKKKIVTPILGAGRFYPSEAYHQDYAARNPIRYKFYRSSCGRDRTVKKVWGKSAYRGIAAH